MGPKDPCVPTVVPRVVAGRPVPGGVEPETDAVDTIVAGRNVDVPFRLIVAPVPLVVI